MKKDHEKVLISLPEIALTVPLVLIEPALTAIRTCVNTFFVLFLRCRPFCPFRPFYQGGGGKGMEKAVRDKDRERGGSERKGFRSLWIPPFPSLPLLLSLHPFTSFTSVASCTIFLRFLRSLPAPHSLPSLPSSPSFLTHHSKKGGGGGIK
jgi:hypothetical protein